MTRRQGVIVLITSVAELIEILQISSQLPAFHKLMHYHQRSYAICYLEDMNETRANDPATELAIINKKRAALQKLVKLTSMLSRLHQGLQSVLLMGNATSYIPDKVINNFKSMTDKLGSQSTDKLQLTLSNTDIKISRDIKHVLEISQQNETDLATQMTDKIGRAHV